MRVFSVLVIILFLQSRPSYAGQPIVDKESFQGSQSATVIVGVSAFGFSVAWVVVLSSALTEVRDDDVAKRKAGKQVAQYLRAHHSTISRDILLGHGGFLNQMHKDLGLSQQEVRAFGESFNGSIHQTRMLQAMNGQVTPQNAIVWSTELKSAMIQVLGETRVTKMFAQALLKANHVKTQS